MARHKAGRLGFQQSRMVTPPAGAFSPYLAGPDTGMRTGAPHGSVPAKRLWRRRMLGPVAGLMLGALFVCGIQGGAQGRTHHGMRADGLLSEALVMAVMDKHAAIAEMLLKRGADANATGPFNKTVLMWAAENGDVETVNLLLDRNVDVNLKDTWFSGTALMRAAERGHGEIVDLLLSNYADVNARNKNGDTALTLAVRSGSPRVVNSLIVGGAEIDAKNANWDTALGLAVKKPDEALVDLLLRKGADPNVRDRSGVSLLEIASATGDRRDVTLLIRNGARVDPNLKDTVTMWNAYQKRRTAIERSEKPGLGEKDDGETALKRAYGELVIGEKEALELHERFGIEEFDRYPKGVLESMYANLGRQAARPPILHVVARSDYSGAVYDYIGWVFKLDHYKAFIAEAESVVDLRSRVRYTAETYGRIESMVLGGHGEKDRIQLGYKENGGILTLRDENDIAQLKPYFVSNPTIVIDACSTGEDEMAIAAMFSRALDATAFAPVAVAEFRGCEVDDQGRITGARFDVPTAKFVSGKLVK